jgi:hypothetical protein
VIERLILTLKQGLAWRTLVPRRREAFLRELRYLAVWHNSHRPHIGCDLASPKKKRWFFDLSASVENRVGELVLVKWTSFREIEGVKKLSTTEGTPTWMLTSQHDVWQDSVSSRV